MTTHYWLVTLLLRLGEYEKFVTAIQHTTSKDKAGYDALCDETHNTPLSRKAYNAGEEWWRICSFRFRFSAIHLACGRCSRQRIYPPIDERR